MNWPFVSYGRFADKVEELRTARAELAAERERNAKLYNFMVWRMGGVAIDVSQLPEAYQPKAPTPINSKSEPVPQRRMPGQARRELAEFEEKAERDYLKQVGRSPQQQMDVVNALHEVANEATR